MRVFCHINDLRVDGLTHLRSMIAAFDEVVLWGPSLAYMEEVASAHDLSVTGRELLDHVNAGRVSIMARTWWLDDPVRRAHAGDGWSGYRWSSLDNEIQAMFHADTGSTHPRVCAFDGAFDIEAARAFAAEHMLDLQDIARAATNELPGYLDRLKPGTDVGLSLVKDALNHGAALAASGADRVFGVPRDPILYSVFAAQAGGRVSNDYCNSECGTESEPRLSNLLETIHEIFEFAMAVNERPVDRNAAKYRLARLLGDRSALRQFRSFVEMVDALVESGADEADVAWDRLRNDLEMALRRRIRSRIKDSLSRVNPLRLLSALLSVVAASLGADASTEVRRLLGAGGVVRRRRRITGTTEGPVTWPMYLMCDRPKSGEAAVLMAALLNALRCRGA
jgi:hypothetical protein